MRILLLGIAAFITAAGCRAPLPPGYVRVEPDWEHRFRAVSAEGSALTLREEQNPENGDLVFWEKIISSRLVEVKGYQLKERREVQRARGTPGVEMSFLYDQGGARYSYLLTLFVRGERVYVFEAAGEEGHLAKDLAAIRTAIADYPGL